MRSESRLYLSYVVVKLQFINLSTSRCSGDVFENSAMGTANSVCVLKAVRMVVVVLERYSIVVIHSLFTF